MLKRALTVLAGVLVFLALIVPEQIARLPEGFAMWRALIRIPVEGLLGAALLVALPPRARRPVAVVLGAALGLLTVVKIVDIGFYAALSRPFDPVLDWVLFDDGFGFLTDSVGRPGAIGVAVAAVVLAVALPVLVTLSVVRLAAVLGRHRTHARRGTLGVATVWLACCALASSYVPGVYVASAGAAELAYDTALSVPKNLQDRRAFTAEVAVDAFRHTPPDQLLTGLKGKDVLLTFVESYGRGAIEDPAMAPVVDAALATGSAQLKAKGYAARSAFLSSPTAGGGSWLAHSTFLSGVWIDNEQRYRSLVNTDRLTLPSAFGKAGWRTVGIQPGITFAWPEGAFYRYDQIYDAHTLGYRGPAFSWSTMPDQFALESFARSEYTRPGRGPLLAEITLTSSHTPWAHVPDLVGWDQLGDGTVFGPMAAAGQSPQELWKNPARVRAQYARSIAYSIGSVTSFLQRYADDDLVLVFLGDHQPNQIVVGPDAGRDVPVTVVAKDPRVFDRIASWGWQDGLKPGPGAPVWRMDTFRDRFLSAFSSPAVR